MIKEQQSVATPPSNVVAEKPMAARELAWRTAKIVLQLFAVYCLAEQVSPFFYQQF